MKRLLPTLVVLAVALGFWVLYLMASSGQFKTLVPVSPGRCVAVRGAAGAEDITIDRDNKVALVSSTDRRSLLSGEPVQGAIFAYDLDSDAAELRNLTGDFEGELHPRGLSLYRGFEGSVLFVVNHTTMGDSIEIFEWTGEQLNHQETLTSELLLSPNDVVGVGRRKFYVTNDHGSREGFSRTVEDFLRLRKGNVVYFDGQEFSVVAAGIGYANGINSSPNGRQIYVASTNRGRIHFFVREFDSGALEPNGGIDLGTGVDNIEVDRHGKLWVGAHPKLLSFVRHARNADRNSPSQVLWVDPEGFFEPPVRDAFLSMGDDLSGSSVAAPFGSRLLIGSVFEPHFLDCERASG